jgi:uncharacterized membrane protein
MYADAHLHSAPSPQDQAPQLRCLKERVLQTLSYEAGGLLLVTPLYALVMGAGAGESLHLLVIVSIICMVWTGLHNSAFDWLEARLCRRVASDRTAACRVLHAISHETSSILVTTPAIMWVGGFDFWHALAADVGITVAYAAYALVFHWVFDRLRPVPQAA